MKQRTAMAIGLATALTIALSACGSDSDPGAGTSPADATAADTEDGSGSASSSGSASGSDADSTDGSEVDSSSATDAGSASGSDAGSADWEPVTVQHAFGETTIEERPERVATIDYANQEVPLALGIVPVGMAKMTWADHDGDGMHEWVADKLDELGAETPVLFDETDGYDFEAIDNTDPDVILAGYSGMTQADYDTLTQIAPVVAYPDAAWATEWRDSIAINSKGLGMEAEGAQLIADLEAQIADTVAQHPALDGATGMFLTHVDPTDLSEINFYNANDTRSKFLEDLGLRIAPAIVEASADTKDYSGSMSTEQADSLADVDVMVTYGGDELIEAVSGDPVLSQLPAIPNGIVNLPGDQSIGTAANPTALSIPWILDDYAALLADAIEATDNQ